MKLSKIGSIKIKLHRQFSGKIKTCTVIREVDKWYVSFVVEHQPQRRTNIVENKIGIDVGIKNYAVLSDGTFIDNPKYLKKSEQKLVSKQRQLSKKKLGSKNRKKARIKLAVVHKKVVNQRIDFQHKLSRQLVDNYSFIAIEDLQIRNMVRNHKLAKSIQDCAWGRVFTMLEYKAEEAGIQVERVNPRYTSITCSACGHRVYKTLNDRMHVCPNCGLIMDRDLNGAIKILQNSSAGTAGIKKLVEKKTSVVKTSTTSHASVKQEAQGLNLG